MNPGLRFGIILLALTLASPNLVQAQASVPPGVTPAMVEKGNQLFHKEALCYACHGPDAKGLVGPNLTDDVWVHSKGTFDDIVNQILKGVSKEESKSGIPMPAKGGSSLSDEDVKAVAAYVWSLSHRS